MYIMLPVRVLTVRGGKQLSVGGGFTSGVRVLTGNMGSTWGTHLPKNMWDKYFIHFSQNVYFWLKK